MSSTGTRPSGDFAKNSGLCACSEHQQQSQCHTGLAAELSDHHAMSLGNASSLLPKPSRLPQDSMWLSSDLCGGCIELWDGDVNTVVLCSNQDLEGPEVARVGPKCLRSRAGTQAHAGRVRSGDLQHTSQNRWICGSQESLEQQDQQAPTRLRQPCVTGVCHTAPIEPGVYGRACSHQRRP